MAVPPYGNVHLILWRNRQRRASTSVFSFGRRQDGRTLVLNEDDEKLRWLRLAGVATNKVYVVGTFIKGLTRVKGDRLPPFNLHDHGAFQHIDESVRVMAMDRILRARGIFHDQHIALLAGYVA